MSYATIAAALRGSIATPGERVPDTVVISYPTFVDIVVDLQTHKVKREFEDEIDLTKPVCSTVWGEGELMAHSEGNAAEYTNPEDIAAYQLARDILAKQQ